MARSTDRRLLPRHPRTRSQAWSGPTGRRSGMAIRRVPARYWPVSDWGCARARTHVQHVVGGADHVLVVLDHDHAVAQVAQLPQGFDQAVVVALVQADGRFVEHVHDAGQARADLAGQADALGLAAGQGVGAPVQGQVAQAHVDQEVQPGADFLDDAVGDLAPRAVRRPVEEPLPAVGQRQGFDFIQGAAAPLAGAGILADEDVAGLGAQAGAPAFRTEDQMAQPAELLAHGAGMRFAPAPFQVGDDALEGVPLQGGDAALAQVLEGDLLAVGAVQDVMAHVRIQRLEGRVQVEAVVPRQAGHHGVAEGVAAVPAVDGAGGQAQLGEGDDARRVEGFHLAQAVAGRTGAGGVVEAEQARLQRAHAARADRAGVGGGKGLFPSGVQVQRQGAALRQLQRGLEAFGQPLAAVGAHAQPVHDHVQVPGAVRRGRRRAAVQRLDDAVDADPHEAQRLQAAAFGRQVVLPGAGHRRQDGHAAVLGTGQDLVHHLADALRPQRQVVVRAVGGADPGVQQAQVVVDLGDRAHGRARVVAGGLLFDGDGGRQAGDDVHVGLVHHLQELPRVGRQAFDVAALAFGVQGVEGQGRFPGAGQAREHDQLAPGQVDRDVLQIVGARAADADGVHAGRGVQVFQRPT